MTIRCEIVSQDKIVFQDNVDIVLLPGEAGHMGILPNHSPLLTVLKSGIVSVRSKEKEQYFTVSGGIAEVQSDLVTILADAAENVEEIDINRAEAARDRAEKRLKGEDISDKKEFLVLQSALNRSNIRIDAVQRYRNTKDKKS